MKPRLTIGKVKLSLPQGGISEKSDDFDFFAPDSGYMDSFEIEIYQSETVRKEFFLKLVQGYIRFRFQATMGKDLFIVGDYYFNPDGSRNLEPQ